MTNRQTLLAALLFTGLLLQACGPSTEAAIQTGIAQTMQVADLQTAAAVANQPQDTATPDAPAEFSPTPPAMVSVSENTNCRRGPSASYGHVITINAGQQVEVLKTFDGADYVVVANPEASGDCWLWLRYADQSDFSDYNLPTATQPPTPVPTNTATATHTATPVSPWQGSWSIRVFHGGVERTGPMSCSVNGMNISCSVLTNPGAFTYNFSGTLDASHQNASGTFSGTGSGNWAAQLTGSGQSQFVGNLDMGSWEFCGTRSGGLPNPCKWP